MIPEEFSFNHINFNLLQLMLSACVAAVKCRPVTHHCIYICWSPMIIDCMLLTFEKKTPAHGSHLLLLMNSFNKRQA